MRKGINFLFLYSIFDGAYINSMFRSADDTSNFSSYPDSDTESPAVKPADDPFLDW